MTKALGWRWLLFHSTALGLAATLAIAPADGVRAEDTSPAARFVDLSLLVAPELPGTWPAAGFPPFHMNAYLRIGPLSAYNSDILAIDGNTGTQLDVPPHSVPHPDTRPAQRGTVGRVFTDKVPAWQFGGEACVVDCRDLLDSAANGHSALVKKERIIAWEKEHRPLGPGDVVLLQSGYTDKYFQPLPGRAALSGRSGRGHARRPGPIPIPTAWSTWPAAR